MNDQHEAHEAHEAHETDDQRPKGEDIELPEEQHVDGETVEADTASGGAPDPA